MTFSFRPAERSDVNLLIGIVGGTGGGKSFSAMRLASGIAQGKPFAVIDTENGRARHYADMFKFDACDLKAPFSPDRYTEAIVAADEAGYPVIVIDSMSHSWAGDGGVLDMQEAEFERMGSKESAKMASWIKPKKAHKQMVSQLLQVRAHVIMCFRAEPKIEMIKENGKTVVVPKSTLTGLDGWVPVCDKNLPFELTLSALLMADKPGAPHWIKLQEQHKAIFAQGELIDELAGERLLSWAKGGGFKPTIVDQLKSINPRQEEQQETSAIRLDELELLLIEAKAEDLKETWADIVGICRRAKDQNAYGYLERVKDRRKKELGL